MIPVQLSKHLFDEKSSLFYTVLTQFFIMLLEGRVHPLYDFLYHLFGWSLPPTVT